MGYSGGAIATDWAAALAPSYAPEVDEKLVGYAEGGLLVDPAHNLEYVDGSLMWAGVIPSRATAASVKYHQYDLLSHTGVPLVWAPTALDWLGDRFAGEPAPSDCGDIPAGNSLDPEQPTAS